ncbi:hypothetical protein N7492_007240 [Penicillium capsulatum]|uniref:Uncharacterized protein n=1 Tax=Penicillium capsulatum TaxID=69766 RepID=A0A9W9I1M5_9EURO|nr:hypothetical protein N7492_007240 [Penicillium capsulatum]KAJ6117078.1 hypothetical protein N7512_006803 [Penicillium capsulatum]
MKTTFFLVLAGLAANAVAVPTENAQNEALDKRTGSCFHPSSCSVTWSGKCEDYCGKRGFSHMTGDGCSGLSEKCCCSTK